MREYTIQRASLSVAELLEDYWEADRFEQGCRSCGNYGVNPGCPPHDFDVKELWRRYGRLELYAVCIPGDASWDEADRWLTAQLLALEKTLPGSRCLCPGSDGGLLAPGPRYSIQSLGGNVEKVSRERLGMSLQWGIGGAAPERLVLVGGLLLPEAYRELIL